MRLVMSDLWSFLKTELLGGNEKRSERDVVRPTEMVDSGTVQKPVSPLTMPITNTSSQYVSEVGTYDKLASGQEVFVAYPDTPCYLRPAIVRDTVLGKFPYATTVRVVARQAMWVRVANEELEGWTERTHLSTDKTDVVPSFVSDTTYDAGHPETLKLRTYISDEFGVVALHLPALNVEYVWFRMLQDRNVFSWPPLRPRTPGRWSEILRPEPSVHVSAVPMTSSIMEYTDPQKTAQLWYVEAVTPEESVTVSGFTGDDTGSFVMKTLTRDEWTSLQPRYIMKK